MDIDVPSVDKLLDEGLNDVGGAYAVARGLEYEFRQLETFDDRAMKLIDEGIQYLEKFKSTIEKLLDKQGQYNYSDRDGI